MDGDLIISYGDEEEDGANANADEPVNIEQELKKFRLQWQQELRSSNPQPSDGKEAKGGTENGQDLMPSIEEQAKYLFLQGVNAEQSGRLYEAIQYYRRAVQLVPDIEFRIEEFKSRPRKERTESGSSVTSDVGGEEDLEVVDLIQHFQKMKAEDGALCLPDTPVKGSHISALPVEVLVYIMKWVVSTDIDVASLERLSMVSRGFYICSRDEELWRLICHRTWGLQCGSRTNYGSYRNMFITRPHLRFNGCYIGKSSYYRQGEKSLDNFYKPYHLVEYFRYVRFFPEGQVLMLTTPEDPHMTVSTLKTRGSRVQGILHGYYRMAGDQVTLVLQRRKVDYSVTTSSYKHRRRRQQQNDNEGEQTFHVEFLVQNIGRRPFAKLVWSHYAVHTVYRLSGQETVAEFELGKSYPDMVFSCVKSYTAVSEAPLQ